MRKLRDENALTLTPGLLEGDSNRLVLSAPHCSTWVPANLRTRIALSDAELAAGADLGTGEIVRACADMPKVLGATNRLVLDINRTKGDRSPDGIFRMRDFSGQPVFRPGEELSAEEQSELIISFHDPFHRELRRALADPSVCFFIEVHSMDDWGGADSMTGRIPRPDFILGNFGDCCGHPEEERGFTTCSAEILAYARDLIREHFSPSPVTIDFNGAFYGGWNTGYYGSPLRAATPGFQIEFNKRLFQASAGRLEPERVGYVAVRFARVVQDLVRFVASAAGSLCGSVWQPPLPSEAVTRGRGPNAGSGVSASENAWDQGAGGWGRASASEPQGLVSHVFLRYAEVMAQLLARELTSCEGPVCDLGCGNGQITAHFARATGQREFHLVDKDVSALDVAERRLSRIGCATTRWSHDVLCGPLPLPNSTIGTLVSVNVFHNFRHGAKRRLLIEAARVLRPGGRLALVDVLTGAPSDRVDWRDAGAIRRRVDACPHYDAALKDCIVTHYVNPACTWSIWYTLDNEYVASTGFMLHWLANTGLFEAVSAHHGCLSDYVITAVRNDRPWASGAVGAMCFIAAAGAAS